MHSRRAFLALAGTAATAGLAGCETATEGGSGASDSSVTTVASDTSMTLSSSAFMDGGPIPARYTWDGDDVSPPLEIAGVPGGAASLALIVDDPDAPGGTFVHWLLWNVPADTTEIPEGQPPARRIEGLGNARQGTNGFGELGYGGPRPPEEDDAHTYRFTLYVIDQQLNVQAGSRKAQLDQAMDGNTIASARLTGEYARR